ncbi:MAG: cytidylyltransferase domain-containing protein [Fusobacteriaceae bacterium]
MKIIALFPMRGGSERVKNKNLKIFNGKPLYQHMLNTLLQSDYIKKIVIDTDSEEIKKDIKNNYKNNLKIDIVNRLPELIGGEIPMNKIINHDINLYEEEHFLQTHSTNPNLSLKTLNNSIETYFKNLVNYDSLAGVTELKTRLYTVTGKPINHNPFKLERTQDLESVYEENSNIYIFSKSSFDKKNARIGEKPFFYPINKLESLDIDYIEDFYLAEMANKILYGDSND